MTSLPGNSKHRLKWRLPHVNNMDGLLRREAPCVAVDAEYNQGDCQICRQKNVKVKYLECGIHMYCRMCAEFIPRLAKGDLQCKICIPPPKTSAAVDDFLYFCTSGRGADRTVHVGDIQLVSDSDDDVSEENYAVIDADWNHLLQSIVTPSPLEQQLSTFVNLTLPSATLETSSSTSATTSENPNAGEIRQLETSLLSGRNSSEAMFFNQQQTTKAVRDVVANEEERGTSPCKGRRLRRRLQEKDYRSCIDLDEIKAEIGCIEGPGFDSTSSSRSASSVSSADEFPLPGVSRSTPDDFWDK